MELEYFEGSASAGMFDSLVSHVGHEVIGIANTAISANNAFWKAVHWFNLPAKLYGLGIWMSTMQGAAAGMWSSEPWTWRPW